MDFCKAFNAQTQKLEPGLPIPVVITAYADKSFTFHHEDAAGVRAHQEGGEDRKGQPEAEQDKVGKLTRAQAEEIAKAKMPDLTAADMEAAVRTDRRQCPQHGRRGGGRVAWHTIPSA